MLSLAEENYLKAIYHLASNGESVLTNEIAEAMQTKAASVTDMLKKVVCKVIDSLPTLLWSYHHGAGQEPGADRNPQTPVVGNIPRTKTRVFLG
jgi:hypothetical protein